jgi:hypothetical protein
MQFMVSNDTNFRPCLDVTIFWISLLKRFRLVVTNIVQLKTK